jgi:hypothetical protein
MLTYAYAPVTAVGEMEVTRLDLNAAERGASRQVYLYCRYSFTTSTRQHTSSHAYTCRESHLCLGKLAVKLVVKMTRDDVC